MKTQLLLLMLLVCSLAYSQPKQKQSDLDKANACIAEHTTYFTFNGEQPTGEGWRVLEGLFAQNQFVAWGEYHNSPLLSKLTAFALASASKNGYQTWCVETSPFVAGELTRIAGTKSPADTLVKLFGAGYPKIGTFPFFSTPADAQMLTAAHRFKINIWGIDQEFQTSFTYGLSKVYNAQPRKIKQQYKTVYDSLVAKWWYPDAKLLDSLKNTVRQKEFKTLLDDIKISKEIYRYNDNEGRAALMKRNFYNYYNAVDKNEKVFFKMGSNHLAKGINLQTNLYDIGNAVYELAQRNRTGFANVYIMARYTTENGKIIDDLEADENENPKIFSKLYQSKQWVLIDIRTLRAKLHYDNTLPRDACQVIEKYDYVLVSPEVMR